MSWKDDFRVLDAIGNSLQGRTYQVGGGGKYPEEVRGITWQTLLESTGLPAEHLKVAVSHLLEKDLVGQGGPVDHTARRLLGRRKPLYLWVTSGGRQALEAAAREADQWT